MKLNDEKKLYALLALLMSLLCLMFTSCKTKIVTVPEVHKEYVVKTDSLWQLDSVLVHDSVCVMYDGDTIKTFKFLYRDRYRYIYRNKKDTTVKRDSVPYAVPVTVKEVKEVGRGWKYLALALLLTAIILSAKLYTKDSR